MNKEKPNLRKEILFNRGKDNVFVTNVVVKNGKIFCERDKNEIIDGDIVEMKFNGYHLITFIGLLLELEETKKDCQWHTIADNIWKTINNPITDDIICGNTDLDELTFDEEMDSDYYIGQDNVNNLEDLRIFHNYVKSSLINTVGKLLPGSCKILDTSCGRGGDSQKYIALSKHKTVEFYLGLDISSNITEAANRYYYESQKNKVPKALFLQYDTSKYIHLKEGCMNFKCEQILDILMNNTKQYPPEYENLYKHYHGIMNSGFDLISSQFSFHYYFQSESILEVI